MPIIMMRPGVTVVGLGARCDQYRVAGARGWLLRAAAIAIVFVGAAPVRDALAAPPNVTITSPTNGSITNNQTPYFSGTTDDPFNEDLPNGNPVLLKIYAGAKAEGKAVQKLETSEFGGTTWTVGPTAILAPGTYTAQAQQSDPLLGNKPGKSVPVTFSVDTTTPQVTLTSPSNGSSTSSGSQLVSGSAGTAAGDLPAITVQLFVGSTIGSQGPLETLTVQASGGSWSATFGGLSPGTYVARAEQRDEAGNIGISAPVSFTVTTSLPPTSPTPPAASFKWFPSVPKTGERVSLVSSSTDKTSPIVAFAWALTSAGPFSAGNQELTTSFATPGDHVARLRVTAADGLSSVATKTIRVIRPPLTLMQPFPIVRMAGTLTASGVRLSLLTAQALIGARVTVTCRGRGCPTRSESRVAASHRRRGSATMAVITFWRFERSLEAGVILEIRISRRGEIGKYTRFVIRRGRLPQRVDSCVDPAGIRPIACPSS
jgi:hypothetical protein